MCVTGAGKLGGIALRLSMRTWKVTGARIVWAIMPITVTLVGRWQVNSLARLAEIMSASSALRGTIVWTAPVSWSLTARA
jgi:hypothetical protein